MGDLLRRASWSRRWWRLWAAPLPAPRPACASRLPNRRRCASVIRAETQKRLRIPIGKCRLALKDYAAAARSAQDMLDAARALGADSIVSESLGLLGEAALGQGQVKAAHGHLDESLRLARALGEVVLVVSELASYARLLGQAGQPERALELLGLALAHPAASPETRIKVNAVLRDLTGQDLAGLPPDAQVAFVRGAQLDLDAVVRELLGEALPTALDSQSVLFR